MSKYKEIIVKEYHNEKGLITRREVGEELVRCKDCKYSRVADMDDQEDGYLCSLLHGHEFFSYDYCSYGDRKEQDHE